MSNTTRLGAIPADDEFKAWARQKMTELLPVSEHIIQQHDQHAPIMFIWEKDSERVGMMPLPQFMENAGGKDFVAYLHKAVGARMDMVDGAIFVTETWILRDREAAAEHAKKPGSLAKHPKREEALMFSAIRGRMQLVALYMISGKGKKRKLSKAPDMFIDPVGPEKEGGMTGRFTIDDTGGKLNS